MLPNKVLGVRNVTRIGQVRKTHFDSRYGCTDTDVIIIADGRITPEDMGNWCAENPKSLVEVKILLGRHEGPEIRQESF
jgi:hypothetical protein